jgi:membrane-bound ClpP family serine protease
MDEWAKIAILYALGGLVLVAELFIPSSGLLMVVGLALFGWGLFEAFAISWAFGVTNALMLMIVVPAGVVFGIRNWHRTFMGRRMSPPNPKLGNEDRLPVSDMQSLVGRAGRSVTVLRPVGTCEFAGKRLECKAESGFIGSGVQVEAVGLSDRTVLVRALPSSADA